MKLRVLHKDADPNQIYTQIGSVTADIDEELLTRFKLRAPLKRLAAALTEQMKDDVTQDGRPVVGVQITGIDFQRLFGYSEYDKKREAERQ